MSVLDVIINHIGVLAPVPVVRGVVVPLTKANSSPVEHSKQFSVQSLLLLPAFNHANEIRRPAEKSVLTANWGIAAVNGP